MQIKINIVITRVTQDPSSGDETEEVILKLDGSKPVFYYKGREETQSKIVQKELMESMGGLLSRGGGAL